MIDMPRYLVERTFTDGLGLPATDAGEKAALDVVDGNSGHGVTWVHSYVSPDRSQTWCIYDGPSPEAIRAAASATGLPIDKINEIKVLDPYFLH
jgi:hypothetical protein